MLAIFQFFPLKTFLLEILSLCPWFLISGQQFTIIACFCFVLPIILPEKYFSCLLVTKRRNKMKAKSWKQSQSVDCYSYLSRWSQNLSYRMR